MIERFRSYISSNHLLKGRRPLLAAVSGGLDSVVLAQLLNEAGIPFEIAHCNFGLRGRESNGDELFVRKLAMKYGVPFHLTKFPTATYAKDNGLGIQAAARNLRYGWFNALLKQYGLQSVATAHHADDLVETILLNLVRGTGLAGHHGIKPKTGNVIRPLLFATREELETYAGSLKLKWRNDSSNDTDHYTRNRIRHHVIPTLKAINPMMASAFLNNAAIMTDYEAFVKWSVDNWREKMVTVDKDGKGMVIRTTGLSDDGTGRVLMYEILRDFGFNGEVCRQLSKGITVKAVGNKYQGEGFTAVIGRDRVSVSATGTEAAKPVIQIEEGDKEIVAPYFSIRIEQKSIPAKGKPDKLPAFTEPTTAYLDTKALRFPLELRPWEKGDRFRPLGMKGSRLVSDFITDIKMNNQEKEHLYLLLSEGRIAWVVGYRIDDRFKLTGDSQQAIRLTFRKPVSK